MLALAYDEVGDMNNEEVEERLRRIISGLGMGFAKMRNGECFLTGDYAEKQYKYFQLKHNARARREYDEVKCILLDGRPERNIKCE